MFVRILQNIVVNLPEPPDVFIQVSVANEFKKVGELITKVVKGLSENPNDNSKVEDEVRKEVVNLTAAFPIYKNLK